MKTDSPTAAKAREPEPDTVEWWRAVACKLSAEIAQWKTWGIVEVAVRNPQVAEYCKHLEERTQKAESELVATEKRVREECCKAVCLYCNYPARWKPATLETIGWAHSPKTQTSAQLQPCGALAIRSLELKGE